MKMFLQSLMRSETIERHNQELDDKYFRVLVQLRYIGLFEKEDIQRYDLLHNLCTNLSRYYFAEKRFRFLVEWDPTLLLHADKHFHLTAYCMYL
ncbi:MAG: hypothetical protein ACI90V_011129 [Bacillariaceae sp.]|jgi:hypothetical protein